MKHISSKIRDIDGQQHRPPSGPCGSEVNVFERNTRIPDSRNLNVLRREQLCQNAITRGSYL